MYRTIGKRTVDLLAASTGLLVLAPFLLIIAGLVICAIGRPILFIHTRPGRFEKPFRLLKFRTMRNLRLADGSLAPDSQRMIKIGNFLRRASLDELPELINVIRGDMSLVGPRPLLVEYLSRYNAFQHRRHEVRPGITGWAQVNGRNSISWERRFEYDVWYTEHLTFAFDLRILLMTVLKVLKREGITDHNEISCEPFHGNIVSKQPFPPHHEVASDA